MSRHRAISSSFAEAFETGTLSPVSMLSFTIASPDKRKMSAGKRGARNSERLTMSPGTSFEESSVVPAQILHHDSGPKTREKPTLSIGIDDDFT